MNIERLLVDELASTLGVEVSEIDPARPFRDIGLDSARTVAFVSRVGTSLGYRVPVTAVWEYPTVVALAGHLASAPAERLTGAREHRRAPSREPVAIVGLACRLPGAASIEGFWELLRTGSDAITTIPSER